MKTLKCCKCDKPMEGICDVCHRPYCVHHMWGLTCEECVKVLDKTYIGKVDKIKEILNNMKKSLLEAWNESRRYIQVVGGCLVTVICWSVIAQNTDQVNSFGSFAIMFMLGVIGIWTLAYAIKKGLKD